MTKIIILISILCVWLLSGFYTFEISKGGTIADSVQLWDLYMNSAGQSPLIIIHLFLSVIVGAILGLAVSSFRDS